MHKPLICLLLCVLPAFSALGQPEPTGSEDAAVALLPLGEAVGRAKAAEAGVVLSAGAELAAETLEAGLAGIETGLPAGWSVFVAEDATGSAGGAGWPAGVCMVWQAGELVDWDSGFGSVEEIADWLGRVERGEVTSEYARERFESSDGSVMARSCLGRRLTRAGLHEEAAEAYLVCFEDPTRLRPPFLLRVLPELRAVGEASEAARSKIAAAAEERMGQALLGMQDPNHDIGIFLSSAAGEADRVAEWLNAKERELTSRPLEDDRPTQGQLIEARMFAMRRRKSIQLVVWCGDYESIAQVCWQPEREVGAAFAAAGGPGAAPVPGQEQLDRRKFEAALHVGAMYASLLAAGREDEAAEMARLALESWDSPFTLAAILQMSLQAGQVRAEHLAWAERADAELPENMRPGGEQTMVEVVRAALDRAAGEDG